MPLGAHLSELRVRVTLGVVAIVVASIVSALFYKQLFDLVTDPFYEIADDYKAKGYNLTLNFQGIGDPFSYALKICAMAGIFLASPVWMYNLWGFVAPGLHQRERRYGIAFVAVSVPLFLGGAVLAYFFLPKGFDLLIGFNPAPERVANIIGLDNYLSFVLRMFLVFGLAFVLPVFLVALNLAGVVSGPPAAARLAPGHPRRRSCSPPWRRRPATLHDDRAGRADAGALLPRGRPGPADRPPPPAAGRRRGRLRGSRRRRGEPARPAAR